jgi:hypothetical protein
MTKPSSTPRFLVTPRYGMYAGEREIRVAPSKAWQD